MRGCLLEKTSAALQSDLFSVNPSSNSIPCNAAVYSPDVVMELIRRFAHALPIVVADDVINFAIPWDNQKSSSLSRTACKN